MTVLFNIVVVYLIKPTFLLDKGNDDRLDKLVMIMFVVDGLMIPWYCYKEKIRNLIKFLYSDNTAV